MRIYERLDKISWWIRVANTISEKSHDAQTKVGAILINIDTGAILATGYNGFIRNANDEVLPKYRPQKYQYIIHAEQNLICNAARHGVSMDNCICVTTMSPCVLCMRLLWQCGIRIVICEELYEDFPNILKMSDIKVKIEDIEYKDNIYHKITYA